MPAAAQFETAAPSAAAPSSAAHWLRLPGVVLLLVAAFAFPLWHIHVIDHDYPLPASYNDLIGRWVGTRAALHGRDPFSPEVFAEIQTTYYGHPVTAADHVPDQAFNYPAYLVVLLAPLAPLSWPAVRLLFFLTITPLLLLSFRAGIRLTRLSVAPSRAALIALLAFSSWPVLYGMRMLQPALPVCALVLLGCYLLTRNRPAASGFLLALAMVKPQLVLPVLAWLFLREGLRRRWTLIASFAVTFGLLLLLAQVIVPGWIPEWLAAIRVYHALYPTLPLQLVFGNLPGMLVTLVIAGCSAWRVWLLRHVSTGSSEYGQATGLVLALTVLLNAVGNPHMVPMLQAEILLFPAGALLAGTTKPAGNGFAALWYRLSQLVVAWTFAAVPLAVLGESLFGPANFWYGLPFLHALLPAPLALFLLSFHPESQLSPASTPLPVPEAAQQLLL